MDRVLEIKHRSENNHFVLEVVGLTDLWNKAVAMSEEELIVCVMVALRKYPDDVYQALAADRAELLRNAKKEGEI